MPAPIAAESGGVGRESGRSCSGLVSGLLNRLGENPDDARNKSLALEALREAVNVYNLERNWMDRRLVSDITLVASDGTYALPTRFRELVGRAFLVDTNGLRRIDVQDLPYEEFLLRVHDENVTDSTPEICTIINAVSDGILTLWPEPSAASIVTYPTLRIVYYADIPICDTVDGTGGLAVSARLEQAVYAEALYVLNDMVGKADKASRYFAEAQRMRSLAVAYDNLRRVNWGKLAGRSGVNR